MNAKFTVPKTSASIRRMVRCFLVGISLTPVAWSQETPAAQNPKPAESKEGITLLPTDLRGRHATLQWLMWQMGGLGPMAGQNGHFLLYAAETHPYAIERYSKEVDRLYGVLDAQLARTGHFVAGDDYSIADIAIFPWIRTHKAQQIRLAAFAHVERWYNLLFKRLATKRGIDLGKALRPPKMDEQARRTLFGQTAQTVRAGAGKR